jgi:hypothetical protein
MTYEEIVAGFRALQASDFDYENINAHGPERLSELTDALMSVPEPERAVPEMFSVMERMPEADLGSPGPLVHTMERWRGGYEHELVNSVRRCPSLLSVWMVNRILNSDLPGDTRRSYMSLLNDAATHPTASESVRESARDFIDFQMRKA